jgi:hypothetical protein
MAAAPRVTAAAIRVTDNAPLARQIHCCRRADAAYSPDPWAALHPIFDEIAMFAVQ